jgi:hypothetical protein
MNSSWDTFYTEIQTSVSKKDYDKAELLTQQGLSLYPYLDAVYLLTKAFREESQHQRAWKYYLIGAAKGDEEYKDLFFYEKTILNYYVGTPKEEGLLDFIQFYNTCMQFGYTNIEHYTYPYTSHEIRILPFPPIDDFLPTSTSILQKDGGYLLNIRYVNYRIQPDSSYLMMENGVLDGNHHLRTRNFTIQVTDDFVPITTLEEMHPNQGPRHNRNIHGIEDIRLFYDNDTIRFTAASCEYSHNGNIQQIIGTYDIDNYSLVDITPIVSPRDNHIEKNWIPTGNGSYIYSWHPFTLCVIHGSNLQTILTYDTPPFFEHVRGSSTLVFYDGFYYCMTHCIIDCRPRKYYHLLIKLTKEFHIDSYTLPLYFVKNHIEYTLGISIRNNILYSIVSQNDCNPILVKIHMETLKWITIQSHANSPLALQDLNP